MATIWVREVTGVRRDERGRTVALTNASAPWSPVSAERAARQIGAELYRYVAITPGPTAAIKVVSGRHGPYLRSEADAHHRDNLDAMPDAEAQHPLTGGFDVVIELDQTSLGRALTAMHASGAVSHRANVVVGDDVAVLSLGAPEVRLLPTTGGLATCLVRTPILAWIRPRRSVEDVGYTASASVEAPVSCYPVIEADGSITLATDWSAVTETDVTVSGATAPIAARVRKAVSAWAKEAGGRYPVPSADSLGAPTGAAIRFVASEAEMVTQAGLDLAAPVGVGWPAPSGDALRVSLSGHWVVERVIDALRTHFGTLPQPHGTDNLRLGNGISLLALDAELSDRGLVFAGKLTASGVLGGVIFASFTATVRLTGKTSGGIAASVIEGVSGAGVDFDGVSVDVTDLLGRVANFFSGGALRQALTDGIRSAIGSAGGGLADLLSRTTVRATAAIGSAASVRLDTRINSLTVSAFGVVLSGTLRADAPRAVDADLAVLPLPGRWRLLSALSSWTPGDHIVTVNFDFGDGQSRRLTGATAALVAPHEYASGRWTARVTVTDSRGRSASASSTFRVP